MNKTKTKHKTMRSQEHPGIQGLQFDWAKTEVALFTHRHGQKKQLRPKLSTKIMVGSRVMRFNKQVISWPGV